jgi:rRNA maturation endonuclease Nob1
MPEVTIITAKDYKTHDDWYTAFYQCPNCHEAEITSGYKFCPMCGIPVKVQDDDHS